MLCSAFVLLCFSIFLVKMLSCFAACPADVLFDKSDVDASVMSFSLCFVYFMFAFRVFILLCFYYVLFSLFHLFHVCLLPFLFYMLY